jgi:hypothetical protein
VAFEILGVLGDLEVNSKANLQDSKNSKDLEDTLKFPSRLTGYAFKSRERGTSSRSPAVHRSVRKEAAPIWSPTTR